MKLNALSYDKGGEYVSEIFQSIIRELGTWTYRTILYTPYKMEFQNQLHHD